MPKLLFFPVLSLVCFFSTFSKAADKGQMEVVPVDGGEDCSLHGMKAPLLDHLGSSLSITN